MDVSEEKLTVIMPTTLANENHLKECIESLEAQTLEKFKLLFLVDGSALSHGEVVRFFSDFTRPYKVLISTKRRGVSRSLNILARLADTAYLARMDDDDRCRPERLQKELSILTTSKADVVGANVMLIDEVGNDICVRKAHHFGVTDGIQTYIFKDIFFHPTVMYRRDWILKHKYNPSWGYGEDRELWIRARGTRYHNIDDVLMDYRVRPAASTVYRKALKNKFKLALAYTESKSDIVVVTGLLGVQALKISVRWVLSKLALVY